MKIAYLTSKYPAVSHTFVLREVQALRARGVDVQTFSVRRSSPTECLDDESRKEATSTRWLVPPPLAQLVLALAWALATRPVRLFKVKTAAFFKPGQGLGQRLVWLAYLAEATLLAHWLVRERFDRIHCHFGNSGSSTGMLAARLAGIPFSWTCHGSELLQPQRYRLADKVAQADFVACVSKFGRGQLMNLCSPDYWSRLHIVRCGLPASDRQSNNPPPDLSEPMILCVARLSGEKGHLVLLDALANLRRRNRAFRCTLVGDGPMRPAIEERIAQLKLGAHMTLTGSLSPEQVQALYCQADVVVLASFSEGVPVVLMEALACGRPVVATRVGGVPELIEHNTTGLLVAPGDAAELADALDAVLQNPAWAARLGATGAERVAQEFSLETAARSLEMLFRQGHTGQVTESRTQESSCPRNLATRNC